MHTGPHGRKAVTQPPILPPPASVLDAPVADGVTIQVRRHGNPEGPRLFLSHGTGFATDTYFPFWSLLLDRFDLLLFDFRSHGWNPVSDRRLHNFPTFVSDYQAILRAVEQRFGQKPAAGVFHSMSALTALLFEQKFGGFAGLVLFDPPVMPPGKEPQDLEPMGSRLAAATRRRKERFESRDDYISAIVRNHAFRLLRPGVPALMAETLLRPADDGKGYESRCPREYDAQIFEFTFGWSMQIDFGRVECPVKVIGSDPTMALSFMPSTDLAELSDLDYDFLPDTTHFLQMEEPERCVALTIEALESWGLA